MRTFYLRADSHEDLLEALAEAGYELPDGRIQYDSREHCIIKRGTLYQPTGTMLTDSEGFEYPEMEAVPGYHADLYAAELPEALQPLQIESNTPQFRRAGQ